jgi:hypothetical protein
MTIKFSRSRPAVGVGVPPSARQKKHSIGTGLIGLLLVTGGAAGCPGSLDEDVIPLGGLGGAGQPPAPPPPPSVVAGSGGRGGRSGMAGSTPRRNDAAVAAAPCWTPEEISRRILVPKCAGAACHDNMAPAAGLDLLSAGARIRLQNIPSPRCNGRPFVTVQGNNVTGHLFDKLAGMQPMGCGARMPANGMMAGYLDATDVQCLKDWFTRNPPARMPDAGVPPPSAAPLPPGATRPQPPAGFCANPAVDAVEKVLRPLCGNCHSPTSPGGPAAFLDLFTDGARGRIEGRGSRQCPGKTMVVQGRPEGFFFDKVQLQIPNGCGMPMPPIIPYLHPAEIKCLKDWIAPGVAQ